MENLNRIHLAGLRAVEAVGRLGSLRAAAEEMGVTVGAVSQQVQKTEQQLGRTLFERLPKGLTVTPEARELLRQLTAGMAALSSAVTLAERGATDTLTVSVAPVFAGKWLVWRLKQFNAANPGIRIRVDATTALVDPDLSDVDLCIRIAPERPKGENVDWLLDQVIFPVCSPALAAQLAAPGDLKDVPIVRDRHQMFSWDTWLKPNGLDSAILGDGPTYSDGSLCLDAAVAGQGVFLAWETLACDALAAGRVVAPFPDRYATDYSYWLIVARHAKRAPGVRAFDAWLRAELAASLSPDRAGSAP